jgi:hypothetical protein
MGMKKSKDARVTDYLYSTNWSIGRGLTVAS